MKEVPPRRVAVVIASSGGRTAMFIERAMPSVYRQVGIDPAVVSVVVVDDNADVTELDRIDKGVLAVRAAFRLEPEAFATTVCRNERTRGNSGTGAWNTGLALLAGCAVRPEWVAILDDDDEFLSHHLARCVGAARDGDVAVFERLEWVRAHGIEPRPFTIGDLSPEAFFVGNPGVQGSNLFVRLDAMLAIDGFDEVLPNTTDRDLMIRLLRYARATGRTVAALPSVGARYFDHDGPRVNTDLLRKRVGLDLFYAKHAGDFSPALLALSLERARRLFDYESRP
jgi:hypothetical protein